LSFLLIKRCGGERGGAQVRQGDQFNIKTRKPQPTILLHIGETVRGDHLFINGYEKKTTPYLATLPIANFGIIQSCFNQTVLSIPCLFQGLQKEGPYIEDTRQLLVTYLKQFHHQNNFNKVVEIFHQIGFKEVYIGPPIGRSVDYLFSQPYLERIVSKAVIKKLSDPRAMINQALSYLNKNKNSTKPLLVITRNKGSHSPFSIRYPKDFHPQGEPQNPTLFDMYDKTIMYLDYTINKEIAALKKLKKPSIFIYTSDHGESLNEVGLYDHVNLTKENFMVPFFIWVSDEYKKAYPKKYRALLKNVKIGYNKISQDYWINSILDGVGIVNKDSKNPVLNSQKSVFSADMKPEFPDFKWSYVHYPRN
jgi:lipid A ethanolaminephosphotransferase